jgi:hypothetical protein
MKKYYTINNFINNLNFLIFNVCLEVLLFFVSNYYRNPQRSEILL